LGAIDGVPQAVAELGPGNSLGTGLAALISGASRYYAFDVMTYSPNDENLRIFDELVELFQCRAPIPDGGEFSAIKTSLDSYSFPNEILDDGALNEALDPARIRLIRKALKNGDQHLGTDPPISYVVPWMEEKNVIEGTVDMVFSMSVFEHIDDLDQAYAACGRWLRGGGVMSHEVDFRSHGLSLEWNGHWGFSRLIWRLIRGRRPFLINRKLHSDHIKYLENYGFEILANRSWVSRAGIKRAGLAIEFAGMSNKDFYTSGAYLLSLRR
jgi:SAM-dependent methyltransferase